MSLDSTPAEKSGVERLKSGGWTSWPPQRPSKGCQASQAFCEENKTFGDESILTLFSFRKLTAQKTQK